MRGDSQSGESRQGELSQGGLPPADPPQGKVRPSESSPDELIGCELLVGVQPVGSGMAGTEVSLRPVGELA